MSKVWIAYSVSEKDAEVKAVCTSEEKVKVFLKEFDCYREVELDKEIPNATWEDYIYKTDVGYMSVE